jgi:Domain of unknown function (DUF4158)
LPQDIDPDTLRKYFTLTRPDLEQVDQCRGATNKLGFAVQLCTLRWRGHFLRDTREIPEPVLETLSLQLGVLPIPIDDYPQNEKTRFDHLERIRQHLKFIRCDASQRERLLQHLTDTAQALSYLQSATPLQGRLNGNGREFEDFLVLQVGVGSAVSASLARQIENAVDWPDRVEGAGVAALERHLARPVVVDPVLVA